MRDEPSLWDKILYGQGGKPAPPAAPSAPAPPPTLEALFAQLDTNKNGLLSVDEISRALLILGLDDDEYDAVMTALCGDAECPSEVTYAQFDERMPETTRATIQARLTADGVLPSLYLPPEKWTDTKTAAYMRWQARVQGDARRNGNQLRQNEILGRELGKQ